MKKIYRVKPLASVLNLENAPINSSAIAGQWPCSNVRVSSNRVERRWDHETFRTFDDEEVIQTIPVYSQYDGTQIIFALTDTDLCRIRTGSSETYSYVTDTYTTGLISSVSGAVITGDADVNWDTDFPDLQPGDKFIINADHTANGEPDSAWGTILTVDSDTQITLTANYAGSATSGAYKIRKVHTTPSGERWCWGVLNGKFCFSNGNVYAQYWDPSLTYATTIDTTYVYQARYCTAFANRLWWADLYDSSTAARNPWLLRGSKFRDPTDYTDSTAVDYTFYDSSEPITGVGVVDGQMVVYKKTSYNIGTATGESTDPVRFSSAFVGPGLFAPYSLVPVMSTNVWVGVDDFYIMNGNIATSIGGPIRKKFFSLIDDDDLEAVFGVNNYRSHEVLWCANTSEGQYVFSWNYKDNSWSADNFDSDLTGFGGFGR